MPDEKFVGCACKCICHIHNGRSLKCTNLSRPGSKYCYNCRHHKGCKRRG